MNPATEEKLRGASARHAEISALLSAPEVAAERARFRDLSIEFSQLGAVVETYAEYRRMRQQIAETRPMLEDADAAIRALAEEEMPALQRDLAAREAELEELLLPKERVDARDIFLEIRAGTGGDEAALFAGDLFKMYHAYAERRDWRVEVVGCSEGEHGGYKEIISRISGAHAHARMKFESGAHRVQRVPETESQGRIHTSACTVAVLPEAGEMDDIEINPAELRIDTFRASGAGGQHVNKTDSAIRITHLPSGLVVECQEQRSQHKNRVRALSVLKARLLEAKAREQRLREASTRKSLVGSGDRSERIRTYNFPQGRVTEHRVGLTLYKLDDILAGNLDQLIEPLLKGHRAELLAEPAAV
ncbi:MAG: peptide chain release factor 1 [Gammaproteobacteria bacterium]